MFRAAIKSIGGHRARLGLTLLAIVVGVSFVAGTFVFTDAIGRAFDGLFADAFAGIDVEIGPVQDDDLSFLQGERLPGALVADLGAVDGVEDVWGVAFGYAQMVSRDGEPLGAPGFPNIGTNYPPRDDVGGIRLRTGRPPRAPDEITIDAATAAAAGFGVGDRIDVLLEGPTRRFTIVGVTGFGNAASPGGATVVSFTGPTAQEVLETEGGYDSIRIVAADGTDVEELIRRLAPLLPEGTEAQPGEAAAGQGAELIKDQLSIITTVILVFAGIALFVGAFIIQNTFRIVVVQRTRELALLRALGATRKQVTGMVLLEAFIVGLIGSLVGVVTGVGLAVVLRLFFVAAGVDFPQAPLSISARTLGVSVAAGVGVTMAAALLPARKAAAIAPVAAMSAIIVPPSRRSLRVRSAWGAATATAGVALILLGLFIDIEGVNNLLIVGAGAGLTFVGVAVLSPAFARPATAAIGSLLGATTRPSGSLARRNAMYSPRRSSATASALMVGLTLVTGIAILAASLRTTVGVIIEDSFRADFAIQQQGTGLGPPLGISPAVADGLEALPQVADVSRIRGNVAKVGGRITFVGAVEPNITDLFSFDVGPGSFDDLVGDDTVALNRDRAAAAGLGVGDTVDIEFARTGTVTLRIVALWDADAVQADHVLSLEGYRANFVEDLDTVVYVGLAEGVDPEAGRTAVESVTDRFATADVFNAAEFRADAEQQLNRLLALVFGLLALAIVISLVGITNTLALSVIERTREIGILRAVGMTRPQVRSSVRWEAAIVAVFGAVLGVLLGIALGWVIVRALRDQGIVFTVPLGQVIALVVASGLAGVIAAVYPARRAARLDVIEAIAYE